jgi:short-subunit dehydrogenase
MATQSLPFALVTGASSGIGFELAKCCAERGFELLIAAEEPEIEEAAQTLRASGALVEAVQVDLATRQGVETLYAATRGRPVTALLANAGRGLGRAFLDQDFDEIGYVIDTNITGTLYLVHLVGREMLVRREGKILITGSIAGFMPGAFQAVYNGTKAMLDSFAYALREELKDTGITVTCLMPGPTETEFFERAGLMDTKVGVEKKQGAAEVAKMGFDAMMNGDASVITGWKNKVQATVANVMPNEALAAQHRKMAEPGTARGR